MPLFELLYISLSKSPMTDEGLIELLDQARDRNSRQGITGMLIYTRREFIQLLEGSEMDVRDIFASIERDDRHGSVDVFYSGAISERAFASWSMAFQCLDESSGIVLHPGFEDLQGNASPRHLLHANPNIGKDLFLGLRDDLI